jgi:hypothetical protein
MKSCPECKYERTIQDNLLFPDYECPSCGIIIEKDKARQKLAELEKQRQIERQAKLDKLKKEKERIRREEKERLERAAQEQKAKEEAERQQHLEAERLRREEIERKRQEDEERRKKEEQEQKAKEEAERQQHLEAERVRQEEDERQHKEDEERLRKEAEEKQRQALDAKKEQEEEAKNLLKKQQEKIAHIVQENSDKIISPTETETVYHLFDMCPFNLAQTGKGLSIAGFGETKNKWQHARCIQKYCRLWTWKTDEQGAVYGQGCSLQFLGLSKEEIKKNFSIKNMQILEDGHPANKEPKKGKGTVEK